MKDKIRDGQVIIIIYLLIRNKLQIKKQAYEKVFDLIICGIGIYCL